MAAPAVFPIFVPLSEEERHRQAFAADVRLGLSLARKRLPSKYLYDPLGSALFDAITVLAEYGLTRADERLLHLRAGEIARHLGPGAAVVELGSGSGRKTRPVLEAIAVRQSSVRYTAIDVSSAALQRCAQELAGIRGVVVQDVRRSYLEGLELVASRRSTAAPLLVLFLGSSVGNFDHEESVAFLAQVATLLRPSDFLLIGADLVKPASRLLAAYDDPAGVTAAFNLNLLGRINRELGGDFDLRAFHHEARWSTAHSRIEMHLRSLQRQTVNIATAGCRVHFEPGETIWTESSHKFDADDLPRMAHRAGFAPVEQWTDEEWPFAECLWTVLTGPDPSTR